ncbi:MAG: hypothetical protein HUK26_07420 [Duodenibacillus sp.]|nr:hypothetical protein [Duodenibacillus sp.]
MPDWCENRVRIAGDPGLVRDFAEMIDTRKRGGSGRGGGCAFDFDRILPMPPSLNLPERCSAGLARAAGLLESGGEAALAAAVAAGRLAAGDASLALAYAANLREHGARSWYDWRLAHWGVKWQPCGVERRGPSPGVVAYRFFTAWGPPAGVARRVRELLAAAAVDWRVHAPGLPPHIELALFEERFGVDREVLRRSLSGALAAGLRLPSGIPALAGLFGQACSEAAAYGAGREAAAAAACVVAGALAQRGRKTSARRARIAIERRLALLGGFGRD